MSYHEVHSLLIDLEAELRSLQLWDSEHPGAEALASTEPFAIDTLRFEQWLQFIFLPRMYELIDAQVSLPTVCGIAPMAEETYRDSPIPTGNLVAVLARIDAVLSG